MMDTFTVYNFRMSRQVCTIDVFAAVCWEAASVHACWTYIADVDNAIV